MINTELKKKIMLLAEKYGFKITASYQFPMLYEIDLHALNSYNSKSNEFYLQYSDAYSPRLVVNWESLRCLKEMKYDYSGTYDDIDYMGTGFSEDDLFEQLSDIFEEVRIEKVSLMSDDDLLSEYESQARKMAILEAEKVKRESDPTKTKLGTIHSAKDYFLKQYDQVSCEELHVISLDQMDHVIKDDCVTIGDNDEIERIAAEVVKKATLSNAAYVYVVNIQKTASTQTLKKNVEIATKINERLKILDGLMADYAVMVGKDYLSYRMKEIDKAINKEEKNENSRYR